MTVLRMLESLRVPAMDGLMQAVTELGSEVFFLVVALVLFWCVSKQEGYYLLTVCFFGTVLNQFLKLLCRVSRPWVLDPEFTIVESARADATGYSFPSGHTQNSVGTFGVLGRCARRTWVRIPADVLTAAGTALALVFLVKPAVYSRRSWVFPTLLAAMSACALAFVLYVELTPFPGDMDPKNLAEGVKNAYSLLGALLGMILAYLLDERTIHFPVQALWWAQILKVIVGLGLTMVLRAVLKAPLLALTGGHEAAHGIRYFCMVLFAGAVWPLTFRWFGHLGGGKRS